MSKARGAVSHSDPMLPPPDRPWVLHTVQRLGIFSERWIDLQSRVTARFDARLLGLDIVSEATRQPHWLVARDLAKDRLDWWLAYQASNRSGAALAWLAATAVRRCPPALLHAHYAPFASRQRLLARALRCPLVVSVYGYDVCMDLYHHEPWRARYQRLWHNAAAVLAEGPAMAARVAALGCPPDKIHVVRLPADADGLASARHPKADEFLVVAAGRFIEKKGFDTAIRAFAAALRDRRDARLMMIGGGHLERAWRELAAAERITDQVIWRGQLPFVQFMGEVSRARLALYPSRTAADGDSEGGAPVTLIEAQWLGVPSLVSDHDDLPFVAAPDGCYVLPPHDLDVWAGHLRALYDEPAALERMGANAESFVRKHHTPAANRDAREALYASVGRDRRPHPPRPQATSTRDAGA